MMVSLNEALTYGTWIQGDKWYADVLKFSNNLIDNQFFKIEYWNERPDLKINAYLSMASCIHK